MKANANKSYTVPISLAQCVTLYEEHFKIDMPPNLPYKHAAQMVRKETSEDEFMRRLKSLDREGNHRKQYTIYKDLTDAGESFTVYDNDLKESLGQFLADDLDLKKYLAAGDLVDGLDNREKKGVD